MASTPCAACKHLKRKCTQDCVYAPFFPPSQPQKFVFIHRVFGASNVAKILNGIPLHHREFTINALYYAAESRLRDPIYGCAGNISFYQRSLTRVQQEIVEAKNELATYVGVDAMLPYLPSPGNPPPDFMIIPSPLSHVMRPIEGMPPVLTPPREALLLREPNQPQEQQQQQQLGAIDAQRMAGMLFHRGGQGIFGGGSGIGHSGSGTAATFNLNEIGESSAGPSLSLNKFGDTHQIIQEPEDVHQEQLQTQLTLRPPEPQEGAEGQSRTTQDEPELMDEPRPQPPIDGGRVGSDDTST